MSGPQKNAVFLERANYRQRRLRDASRLLPILGIVLWTIPLLWRTDQAVGPSNSRMVIYIFGVWVTLIVASTLIARFLRSDETRD